MGRNYTFNNEATLIRRFVSGNDKYGNPILEEEETTLLCDVYGITRREFYSAGNAGYKLSFSLVFNDFEYTGQEIVKFRGKEYMVVKTFPLQGGIVEVTIGEKVGTER